MACRRAGQFGRGRSPDFGADRDQQALQDRGLRHSHHRRAVALTGAASALVRELSLTALAGFPEVAPGASLPHLVLDALARSGKTLDPGDVLVVAQKIVSKAEGRRVCLADVQPSERARALAVQAQKDPRL